MLFEQILWKVFNFAETYTFILVWIAVPLSFFSTFIWLRKISVPVEATKPVRAAQVETPLEKIAQPLGEPKVNTNEANA